METLLVLVKNPDFEKQYNITEENVHALFKSASTAEIDEIIEAASVMTNTVDYDNVMDVTKLREDGTDFTELPIGMPKEQFYNNEDDNLSNISLNYSDDSNMFYTPFKDLDARQFLAINIVNQMKRKIESKGDKPLIDNWSRISSNPSAAEKFNSIIEPMVNHPESSKTAKAKYKLFKNIVSSTNPEILKRFRNSTVDHYAYRPLMFNSNAVGGQNQLLTKQWIPDFPAGLSMTNLNAYGGMIIKDMDKINALDT